MQHLKKIDDEMLGAFADGQLDEADSETVIMAIDNDTHIKERYHRLRRSKDLMKLGFGNARAPSRNRGKYRKSSWWDSSPRVAAAIAVIAVSFGAGKLSHQYLGPFGQNATFPAVASAVQETPEKIILHLSKSDPVKFQQTLEYVETFLLEHRGDNGRIEVVANAGGLDLMRKDKSPLASKVAALIREYENVHFIACERAIRKLTSKDIDPVFVENIHTKETALDYIIGRLQEGGWTYLKADTLSET